HSVRVVPRSSPGPPHRSRCEAPTPPFRRRPTAPPRGRPRALKPRGRVATRPRPFPSDVPSAVSFGLPADDSYGVVHVPYESSCDIPLPTHRRRVRASTLPRRPAVPLRPFPLRRSEVGTPMSETASAGSTAPAGPAGPATLRADPGAPDSNRWKALVFIALAQLMVVLDATIVNIALPSAQQDLGISDGNRQWVVTAYALAFGGLLLFGGRIADLWGRKRAFVLGLGGFAAASALGGAATNEAMMFGARALQGAFGALLAPAALSLLAVMFTDGKERAKAFGIYGAIAGGGGAVGLILGGFLTEYLDWRWTFFVNIPFAVVAAAGAYFVIREPSGGRNRSPLDIPGVVLSTLGLVALVYGFTRAESEGWSDALTIGMFVASAVLLIAFVLVESRVRAPLLPLRVVTERNRGGVYLSLGLAIIAMFGLFLFLTYYLQIVKGYSPVKTGFAFLPMIAGMVTGSTQIGARLMTRVPPRL